MFTRPKSALAACALAAAIMLVPELSGAAPGAPMGPPPDFDAVRPPPFLFGLTLTEAQQDHIFSILHDAAPALREQAKATRKAHDQLRKLGTATNFDVTTATNLAQNEARSAGQFTVLRLKTEHAIYMVLTSEQQAKIAESQEAGDARGPERGHEHGPGGPPPQCMGGPRPR